MRPLDIAWAAGVLEGEGCFTYEGVTGKRPMVVCNMTDFDVIHRLQDVFGVGQLYAMTTKAENKPQLRWKVHRQRDAAAVMMTVYPFMSERRKTKIEEVLSQWRRNPGLHGPRKKKGK